MNTIKIGTTDVPVPDSLDLGPAGPLTDVAPVVRHPLELRAAFLALFPDAESPSRIVPVDDMDVFLFDPNRTNQFVHLGRYSKAHDNFESDTGWFERDEIELWAYVPNITNEARRRVVPK